MVKVSVIVAIYNVGEYLEKCLKSISKQTLEDIEVLMVLGNSKDNSKEICEKFLSDKRFKLIETEPKGLSDARNYGMKFANGEYLAFVDGDDYIEENMYEEMYNSAKEDDSDIVECDFIWEYPNKNIVDIGKVSYDNILKNIRVEAWNKLYKRSYIEDKSYQFSFGLLYEDVNWTYKIIPFAKKFKSVKGVFYHYIQRSNSLSNKQTAKVRDIFLILLDILNYYEKNNILDKYYNEVEYLFIRILLGSSFKRTCKITDKGLKKQILEEAWDLLNQRFPNWKKNIYLKESGKKNIYYRITNKNLYMLLANTFGKKL